MNKLAKTIISVVIVLFVSLGCLAPALDGNGNSQPPISEAQIPIEQIIAMTANAAQMQTQAFYTPTLLPQMPTFTPTVTMLAAVGGSKTNIPQFPNAIPDTGKYEDYRFKSEQEKIKELEGTGFSVEVKAYTTTSSVEDVIAYYRNTLSGWKEEIRDNDGSNITAVRWVSDAQAIIINYMPDDSGNNENILLVKEIWITNNTGWPILTNLRLTKDKSGKEITNSFEKNDSIYILGDVLNGKKGNVVTIKWYKNQVAGNNSSNLIASTDIHLSENNFYGVFYGLIEPPANGWQSQGYNVEVYFNGVFNNMLYFSVK